MVEELIGNLNGILKEKNEKIKPENIREGIQIFDITGEFKGGGFDNIEETAEYQACLLLANSIEVFDDYTGTTATLEDVKKGKIAYSNGERIVGTFIPEKPLVVSSKEPTGDDRAKFWIKKGKNLFDTRFFKNQGVPSGSGITAEPSGVDIKINGYYKNPWMSIKFRTIDLSDYAGKNITLSLEVKDGNSADGGFLFGSCDVDLGNRVVLANYLSITKAEGRKSLTAKIPENITETNRYLFIQLNATGSYTPSSYGTYTTYTNIQMEISDIATEYEAYFDQQLFIKNTDDEYVTFDKNTKF